MDRDGLLLSPCDTHCPPWKTARPSGAMNRTQNVTMFVFVDACWTREVRLRCRLSTVCARRPHTGFALPALLRSLHMDARAGEKLQRVSIAGQALQWQKKVKGGDR
jgi:hypothetical protein